MSALDNHALPPCAAGLTVWRLHCWGHHLDHALLFVSYRAALGDLARRVRAEWGEEATARADMPVTPAGLTDGHAVSMFYGENLTAEPTHGEYGDSFGFTLNPEQVHPDHPDR